MNIRTPILMLVFAVSFLLLFAHKIALNTNLYWTTSWADIVTHTMGGVLVGGIIAYLFTFSKKQIPSLCSILCISFGVGILWEVFELVFQLTSFTDQGYLIDTLGDLFCDFFGSLITYYILDRYIYERK